MRKGILDELLRDMFGPERSEDEYLQIDATADLEAAIGKELFSGLQARVSVEATAKRLIEVVEANREHCKEHRAVEERLEAELERSQRLQESNVKQTLRLDGLLLEIAAALHSGRILTATEVRIGRGNAIDFSYSAPNFLPAVAAPADAGTAAPSPAAESTGK